MVSQIMPSSNAASENRCQRGRESLREYVIGELRKLEKLTVAMPQPSRFTSAVK